MMAKVKKIGACFLALALLVGASWAVGWTGTGFAVAEEEWIQNPANGHYYRLTDPLPWLDAEEQAVEWGGHLVTLRSWDEESWIKDTFGKEEHFWIGFSDIETEGDWVWSSGEPVVYTNWAEGEPNDYEGEDAAIMNWCNEGSPGGEPCLGDTWNDVGIGGGLRGVVERNLLQIDIKPGSYPNSINLGSMGVVPVAVLTTVEFDASTVDPSTVRFAGAAPLRWAADDVDHDGDLDMLFHFKTQELDLDKYSTEAKLTGETYDGQAIQGVDTVSIVP